MKYHVVDRPDDLRHQVDAEQELDGRWKLVDWQGEVSFSSDEDFRRFYEAVNG